MRRLGAEPVAQGDLRGGRPGRGVGVGLGRCLGDHERPPTLMRLALDEGVASPRAEATARVAETIRTHPPPPLDRRIRDRPLSPCLASIARSPVRAACRPGSSSSPRHRKNVPTTRATSVKGHTRPLAPFRYVSALSRSTDLLRSAALFREVPEPDLVPSRGTRFGCETASAIKPAPTSAPELASGAERRLRFV
jgi:hypothetical protein